MRVQLKSVAWARDGDDLRVVHDERNLAEVEWIKPAAQAGPAADSLPDRNRIEVLGRIRAWREGRGVRIGPPQQRGLLALLVAAARRPVPMADIVDALWETQPPRTAVNVIQTYVKRLRQVLEPDRPAHCPSRIIPHTPTGYELLADPYTVDLHEFCQRVDQARRAWQVADYARVVALVTDALARWHGPPGGELSILTHHPLVRAAVEEHRTAVGLLADSSLLCGSAIQALPWIVDAALTRPLDEALQAALIRLYHAVGRRCDAVQTYLDTCRRLRNDLGLDPGPELSIAYRNVLFGQRS
jgi:DNA-binding SARP family transcriptional activator